MIPFSDIIHLTDRVQKKLGCYVNTGVSYHYFTNGPELRYFLYCENKCNTEYDTVSELITAMEKILYPPEDKGVSL